MPRTKETRLPLKGETPKKAPKLSETARKAPPHHEEILVESDSEGSTTDSSSGRSSGSESDLEKRKNTKKPNPNKIDETEPASPRVPDDTESSEESDDSGGEIAADTAMGRIGGAAVPATANGTSKEADQDISESESESEDNALASARKGAKQLQKPTDSAVATSAPSTFTPPAGFKPIDLRRADASTVRDLFSQPATQVWHIIAPSSTPLSEIKEISLASIESHQSVLSHKGSDYTFTKENAPNVGKNGRERVVVPAKKGSHYVSVEAPISMTLHLQQLPRLPNLSKQQANHTTGSTAAAQVDQPPVTHARPQPMGLRMRYKPSGFGVGDVGTMGWDSENEADGDVEMQDGEASSEATFKTPRGLEEAGREKRKREDETPRKEKKRKKEKHNPASAANGAVETPMKDTPSKKQKELAAKAANNLIEGTNAEVPMSKEEKARRKEEKKARKEHKKSKGA